LTQQAAAYIGLNELELACELLIAATSEAVYSGNRAGLAMVKRVRGRLGNRRERCVYLLDERLATAS
jgi:hypothetical protein